MKEKPLNSFRISRFINEEAYGGILLIFATIAAMIWANSSFYESYHHIWHDYKVGFVCHFGEEYIQQYHLDFKNVLWGKNGYCMVPCCVRR